MPGFVLLAAAALLGLLAFGVSKQGTNSSIDSQVAHGKRPALPDAAPPSPCSAARAQGAWRHGGARSSYSTCSRAGARHALERRRCSSASRRFSCSRRDGARRHVPRDSNDAERFVRAHHLSFPVIRDVNSKLVRSFGTTGVPETFVIDRRGRIAAVRRFPVDAAWLAQTLPPILAERS